ncbi:MAG: NAD(P)-binding domain-containing protein, partial [Xanthomonadaceae bacterium]|nr:NAD(P)-binding domain-containing protein [Xanthomonadaceae bacterium]
MSRLGVSRSMNASTRPVVVVGAGSVGSFFGAMLARAGHPVVLVGRPAHVEAIRRDGLKLHMGGELHRVAIAATTELEAVRDAEWVLFCVKSRD